MLKFLSGWIVGLATIPVLVIAGVTFGAGHLGDTLQRHAESRTTAMVDNLMNMDSALEQIEKSPEFAACVADLTGNYAMEKEHAESRCAGWFLAEPE